MRKHKNELLIILVISVGLSLLLPSFMKESDHIEWPTIFEFLVMTSLGFLFISVIFFSFKKKSEDYLPNHARDNKKNKK